MPSDFDIIVRGKDSNEVLLICETKLYLNEGTRVEKQLKQAMARLSCPLGLLLTPEILRVYSDRYSSDVPVDSVELIGEFDSRPLFRQLYLPGKKPPAGEQEFEVVVQRWLETLPQTFSMSGLADQRLAGILATFVVPAVASGYVSATSPRHF